MVRATVQPEEEQPCPRHKWPVRALLPGVVNAHSLSHKEPLSASAETLAVGDFSSPQEGRHPSCSPHTHEPLMLVKCQHLRLNQVWPLLTSVPQDTS